MPESRWSLPKLSSNLGPLVSVFAWNLLVEPVFLPDFIKPGFTLFSADLNVL